MLWLVRSHVYASELHVGKDMFRCREAQACVLDDIVFFTVFTIFLDHLCCSAHVRWSQTSKLTMFQYVKVSPHHLMRTMTAAAASCVQISCKPVLQVEKNSVEQLAPSPRHLSLIVYGRLLT